MSRSVDLFVIGGGSGGVRAGRIAAQHGAKVMLAEEYRLGGTCVIRGCVPKKLFVYAGRYAHDLEDMAGFGWTVEGARFDWPTLIARKDQEIARLEGIYRRNLVAPGVEIVDGRAEIIGPNRVRLVATGEEIEAGHILVATGAHPALGPAIPGAERAITSNEAFHLPRLPPRILIQGGGYIAVEFACLFRALGSEVHLVFRADQILRGFDEDVRALVAQEMAHSGIVFHTGQTLTGITAEGGTKTVTLSDGSAIAVDEVMLAIGRLPNTSGLGLDAVGVATDKVGAVIVDADGRTNVPSIYAVGDVTNRINLTPVAIREGHAFADSVFGNKPWRVDHSLVATAVFTEPEVGTCGLSETAARAAGHAVDIYKSQFRPMRATLSGRETRMLVKLIVDQQSDKVLGCHVVGEGAGEIIQMAAIAMGMGATKADFDRTVAVHPTAAEELVTLRTKSA
ncbi:glutathione reductase [Azorhizobium caulinodans ORS 571]|uniref:Glutathione reductase n=1 Tax=Azorhizobium caulinodans (strain ATCC 43989 / DSM 5975 / JCM 20966 / LMG 6465 / NBRC 14845 / NCIMB 13405 / ORS 571) TaxID=438753 RepID=A8I5X3_AZOC5|nr:glutathione-disulfide reductase [Azorhizobium caulinodans]BAF88332.1 glutathione reductase [Azorhizobium caulinodans ORS 571]